MFALNPDLANVVEPPVAEARTWAAGFRATPGRPLLDLAQAVPSYPPAEALQTHLAARSRLFETAQYTEIRGLPALREAIAVHMAEFYDAGGLAEENVLVTAGCNQAYCVALMALAGRGDEVILPLPYYFNHRMWLDAIGVRAVHLPFREDRAGVPDPEDAARALSPRTRAIVLVSPSNPTGAVIPPDTLDGFQALAASRGVALVLDETYKDFLDGDHAGRATAPHRLFRQPRWGEQLVQLYSFSKVFSLTGYRVGSIVAGAGFVEQAAKLMDCVSICASRVAQDGALYALENLWPWAREKSAVIASRRAAMLEVLEAEDSRFSPVSTGAYFAYVRHPFGGEPSADVARRLARDAGVLCLPGSVFGPGQECYLRFAFANLEAGQMGELGARLAAAV